MASVSKTRDLLYRIASGLGWYSAARNGTLPKRAARVVAGKITGRMLGRIFR